MKRALLIAGGTVGGLGAVLSITPPHLGVAATSVSSLASGTTTVDAPQTDTSRATPVSSPSTSTSTPATTSSSATVATTAANPTKTSATKSVTTKKPATATSATKKAVSTTTPATASQTPTTASIPATTATQTPTPTPTKTTATPTPVASGVSGTFTGATYDAAENNRLWGRVTVTVTLANGEISNISAVQSPSSRGNNAFSYLTPAVLTQKLTPKTVLSISPSSLVTQIRGYTGASYSSFAYWQSLQSALSKAGL